MKYPEIRYIYSFISAFITRLIAFLFIFKVGMGIVLAMSIGILAQSNGPVYNSDPLPGTTINIGIVELGQYSTTRDITVSNPGTSRLTISAIQNSNTGDFDISHDYGFSLEANEQIKVTITCHPSRSGLRTATMSVLHNAPGSPARYNLTCYGGGSADLPIYDSDPKPGNTIDLGSTIVSTVTPEKILKVTNVGKGTLNVTGAVISGTNASDFRYTGTPLSLGSQVSGNISLSCTPGDIGVRTAILEVNHTALDSPATYTLSCVGLPKQTGPGYGSDPSPGSTIDVGATNITSRISKTMEVSETGDAELIISSMTLGGANPGDFTVSPTNFNILDGGNPVTVTIGCTPSAEGTRTATLEVNHNAPNSPATYTLTCVGIQPPKAPAYSSLPVPGSEIDVGQINVGSRITTTLIVSEVGNANLVISSSLSIGANQTDFDISPTIYSIDDGGSPVSVTIGCTPSAVGNRTATLSINHNAADTPAVYNLTCTGITPPLVPFYGSEPTPGSTIDLGTAIFDTPTQEKILKITNTGNGTLNILNTIITGADAGDFEITGDPLHLGASESNQLTIKCKPGNIGPREATLGVNHNASGSPATYKLSCTGILPPPEPGYDSEPPPGSTVDFGESRISNRVTKIIRVREAGNAKLVINSITISGDNPGDFDVLPVSFNIEQGGDPVPVTLGCTPTIEGRRTATIVITHNAANSPAIYTLVCTGIKSEGKFLEGKFTVKSIGAPSKDLDKMFAPDQIITTTITKTATTLTPSLFLNSGILLNQTILAQTASDSGVIIADGVVTSGDVLPLSFSITSLLATKELPITLGGATVNVTDRSGSTFPAGLFSISSSELNWLMPAGVSDGPAKLIFQLGGGELAEEPIIITRTSPGIFTSKSTGSGVPVGMLYRLKYDGTELYEKIAEGDLRNGRPYPIPIDLGDKYDQVLLSLCGTGFRHDPSGNKINATVGGTPVDVYYSGELPGNPGLDQVNVLMPRSLIGKGHIPVIIDFGNNRSNTVSVFIK